MTAPALPKLIATSVVRGSEKGQSHGGVYVIDFASQRVEQKIDWNTGDIDFAGRGRDEDCAVSSSQMIRWIAARMSCSVIRRILNLSPVTARVPQALP